MRRAAALCALLAALLLLAAACAQPDTTTPSPSASTPVAPAVTATAATTPSPTPVDTVAGSPTPAGLEEAVVTRVVDGDTIIVLIGGREFRIRYIGIDTPETVDPRRPVECFGREASERNRDLVEGEVVKLEKDVSEVDRYDRMLRYVWVDGEMVNAKLVEEGYATASAYPPDVAYADLFAALQGQAREAARGLWNACTTPGPPSAADGTCDYSGASERVIKGNISHNTGEKIYHVPGGDHYDQTVIDEAKGERWFCTEADAVAAGWRKSRG
ncbi:MAG: thermonuclease family protein [Dehalococcoidia bacterium]